MCAGGAVEQGDEPAEASAGDGASQLIPALDASGSTEDISLATAKESRLWTCARCRRRFANRNQSHACQHLDLEHHFRGKDPAIRALFERLCRVVRKFGPVTVLGEKTRIAFQVRMSFFQVSPRHRWLDGHLVFARRVPHPRFRRIDTISRRNHVHHFRLTSPQEIDAEFRNWLREAYAVGAQRHLGLNRRA